MAVDWKEVTRVYSDLVRPTITLVLVGMLCYLVYRGDVTSDVFLPVVSFAIYWWFKSRDEKNATVASTPPADRAEVAKELRT